MRGRVVRPGMHLAFKMIAIFAVVGASLLLALTKWNVQSWAVAATLLVGALIYSRRLSSMKEREIGRSSAVAAVIVQLPFIAIGAAILAAVMVFIVWVVSWAFASDPAAYFPRTALFSLPIAALGVALIKPIFTSKGIPYPESESVVSFIVDKESGAIPFGKEIELAERGDRVATLLASCIGKNWRRDNGGWVIGNRAVKREPFLWLIPFIYDREPGDCIEPHVAWVIRTVTIGSLLDRVMRDEALKRRQELARNQVLSVVRSYEETSIRCCAIEEDAGGVFLFSW